MRPRYVDGWVTIDHEADAAGTVEIAVGDPDAWVHAYRDLEDGKRVLRVRPAAELTGRVLVWLRVNGAVTGPGTVTL